MKVYLVAYKLIGLKPLITKEYFTDLNQFYEFIEFPEDNFDYADLIRSTEVRI